jgi:hypothetical protein
MIAGQALRGLMNNQNTKFAALMGELGKKISLALDFQRKSHYLANIRCQQHRANTYSE